MPFGVILVSERKKTGNEQMMLQYWYPLLSVANQMSC